MDLGLGGKRALVSGASRGIGRAIADGEPDQTSITRVNGIAVTVTPPASIRFQAEKAPNG
jgi:hypothetical protein